MKQFIQSFKLTKVLFTIAFVLICGMLFAQGGTSPEASTDIFSFIISLIPVQYQAIALLIVSALWILSEILSYSTRIKANGTFQLVFGWIGKLYNAIKGKKQSS